ncbi:hypothetical protein JI435_446160 [Parastagonospora nodorum SN15]|uniref:Uncharacterized protein n=1 Tax=Phaeosphaeria nodorum (strain SN15 / ATCC MYA-4574 / FGSC 10173) TaxID=321614 RepID=A0A7U2IB79_PHANO|nr:hypothetical protein JI435_446160 [Parastagonospora nodorum SN15]
MSKDITASNPAPDSTTPSSPEVGFPAPPAAVKEGWEKRQKTQAASDDGSNGSPDLFDALSVSKIASAVRACKKTYPHPPASS